jgi:hypothetical protein
VIVTARQSREFERSLKWVEKHYPGEPLLWNIISRTDDHVPGVFETIICTGQSQETIFDHGSESTKKLTKAGVSYNRIIGVIFL